MYLFLSHNQTKIDQYYKVLDETGTCVKLKMFINVYIVNFPGVVAYVEVRTNTENRFEGISKQMELLGAVVSFHITCIAVRDYIS